MVTSGRSCRNGGEVAEALDRGCRGGRVRRGERSVSDSGSRGVQTAVSLDSRAGRRRLEGAVHTW
jgi:hypothetical protein